MNRTLEILERLDAEDNQAGAECAALAVLSAATCLLASEPTRPRVVKMLKYKT
ncbi:hypothetical protein [Desulfonatronum thiodismutans]|uniref:hypothetical protein n=1 Tax=Desulfonatronum thiodismutans TaxID=159290 RepID=UPI00190F6C99|nr:hypothetical protein [Desulfonatronum thiodismutans]